MWSGDFTGEQWRFGIFLSSPEFLFSLWRIQRSRRNCSPFGGGLLGTYMTGVISCNAHDPLLSLTNLQADQMLQDLDLPEMGQA